MTLKFEQGDVNRPRGHAVLYFRDRDNPDDIAATYIVILPVSVDIARYVPPFLAGQVGDLAGSEFTTFAFPPAPERVDNPSHLLKIVRNREDDLIFGGERPLADAAELLGEVGDIVSEYARLYEISTVPSEIVDELPELVKTEDVDDVFYELMGEAEKLTELTMLIGRLRFAAEGGDSTTARDASARIRSIAQHIPENRKLDRLIEVAVYPNPEAAALVQLYLERAYSLLREDYLRVKTLEEQINTAEQEMA